MRYSVRELLIAFTALSCILVGYGHYGLLGASPIALVTGLVLVKRGRQTEREGMAIAGAIISFLSSITTVLSMIGWLFFNIGPSSSIPYELLEMAQVADSDFSTAKIVGLGRFLDSEYAWRLSVAATRVEKTALEYGLVDVSAKNVPWEFWKAFPWRWGPLRNAKNKYFSTPGFPSQSRGPDGDHYFVMYDSQREYLYVWYKSNF